MALPTPHLPAPALPAEREGAAALELGLLATLATTAVVGFLSALGSGAPALLHALAAKLIAA